MNSLTASALLIAGTVAAVFFTEQITAPKVYSDAVHVTYWEKWTDFESDAMRKVVDLYNSTEGKQKHIFVDFMPVSGIEDKTSIAVAGDSPPDIAGLQTIDVAPFADDKAIVILDDYCKKYGIKESDYVPVYWKQVFYNGHVCALPTTPASVALHYNRTLFKEAGLDPNKPPQTFKELDADAEKLTVKNPDGTYKQMGFIPNEPGWWDYGWGFFFGGRLWDGKDKITCNSPENVRAFEWIASYSKKYGKSALTSFKGGLGNFSSPQNGFIEGIVAMEIQGVWMYNFINKFNPKLDWAAAPFPHPADRPDLANMTIADSDNLIIPRGAKHPNEAFDFIAFVQRQPNMELLCMGQRKHSPLVKVSESFLNHHPNPFIRIFNDLPKTANARTPPMMSIWKEYQSELDAAYDDVSLLQKTPKQALDDVHDRVQPMLDEYVKRMKIREAAGG